MIELIVVVVILGVLVALVAPRVGSLGGRAARADAQSVAELLSIAARRDDVTNQRIALEYNDEDGRIRMFVFAKAPDGGMQWREDMLAPAAELRSTEMYSLYTDGQDVDAQEWRIEFSQSSRRPSVELTLRSTTNSDRWKVALSAGSTRATITAVDDSDVPGVNNDRTTIDLDAMGKAEEPW